MFSTIGGTELIIIFLVILIFFGANKIPELARGIGQGMNEFKKASDNLKNEIEKGRNGDYNSPPQKEQISSGKKKEAIEEEKEVLAEEQEKSTKNISDS